MESIEAEVPAEKCSGATGQKLGREGCANDRKAELPPFRYDHTPTDRQYHEDPSRQKGISQFPQCRKEIVMALESVSQYLQVSS